MKTATEYGSSIQGSLLRLGEHRQVAIYLRDGAAWVADFEYGRVTAHIASAWEASRDGRRLVHALRRDAVEPASPLPDETVRRLEALHRRMEAPTVMPAVRRALAAMLAVFRRPDTSILPH